MRRIIPIGFKYGSGKGWKYVWHPEDPKGYYHFETLECLYKHVFARHGVLERFGPMFCHSDIINYGNLHNIDFIRTKTLCQRGLLLSLGYAGILNATPGDGKLLIQNQQRVVLARDGGD
jgi:hypothetical protein